MAVQAELMTQQGETRELYVRLNSGTEAKGTVPALFRGYLSKAAFDAKEANPDSAAVPIVWEREIFFELDVTKPFREQAYAALKSVPVRELPEEPTAPAALPDDATKEERDGFQLAQVQFDVAHRQWEKDVTRLEAENAEAVCLQHAVDV